MRLMPRPNARVVWQEGMHLSPHHFQAQRRYHEDTLALALDALFPFSWGVAGLELDGDALRNGTLALVHARGILPDGTPFHVPDADAAPTPRPLAERFSPTRDAHTVLLALPDWHRDGANVALEANGEHADDRANGNGHPSIRFHTVSRVVADETTGDDPRPVRFAAKNLRLLLDEEAAPDDVALPIARVRRDGAGHFVFDADFIPPCLQIGASPRLSELLRRTVGMLEGKGAALAATLAPAGVAHSQSAYVGNELATRWLLHAVRSAEGPLRHLMATRRGHPERLWIELSRLAGALCTFSMTTQPRDLPLYDHDDLEACFTALERHLRAQLDVVVASNAVVVKLAKVEEALWAAPVTDARCFEPGARWFLGVRSSAGPAATVERVPRLTKVCATKFVLELVRRAFNGLPVDHIPAPPAALAPRPDLTYFELTLDGPCAQALRATREIGMYVPEALPDVAVELAVLVPG